MTRTTEAAVLHETGKPLRLQQLTIPALKAGQVLVDISYSGLCHTQLGEVRGKRGPDRFLPHALGHEGSGVVLEIGEGVKKVKPGDHVVLSWLKGEGADVPSTVYQSSEGDINSGAISTFMRQTITCESRLTPIDKNIPLKEAALLGCAIPTGCGIVRHDAQVEAGQSVAVFGVGGIGMSAVAGAMMAGAAPIIAVDINDEKLNQARALGATHTINPSNCDVQEEIAALTGGGGVDYAIEAAGSTAVMAAAFQSVRVSGGLCIVAGNPPPGETIAINPFDLIRGKKIIGSWGGGSAPDKDIPFYLEAFRNKQLPLSQLISNTYSLDRINQALDDLEAGKIVRTLIDMAL